MWPSGLPFIHRPPPHPRGVVFRYVVDHTLSQKSCSLKHKHEKAPRPRPVTATLQFLQRALPSGVPQGSRLALRHFHSLVVARVLRSAHTPSKKSCSPHARSPPAPVLYKVKHSREERKNTWPSRLLSFFPSLHFSPSLRSISKSQNKLPPLSRWKTAVLHHAEPPLSS